MKEREKEREVRPDNLSAEESSPPTREMAPERPPDLFWQGIDEFNAGRFFECHETLEAVWKAQAGAERQLTQGIIQIAVGYYHCLRGNYAGALKLLKRGLMRVQLFAPDTYGLDLQKLSEEVKISIEEIEEDRAGGLKNTVKIPQIEPSEN